MTTKCVKCCSRFLIFIFLLVSGWKIAAKSEQTTVDGLIHQLQSENLQTRISATYALSHTNSLVAVPILVEALKGTNRLIRAASAYTLSRITSPIAKSAVESVLPQLINDLKDHPNLVSDDVELRAATILAVGAMGPVAQEATPILIQALSDDRNQIRGNAVVALGRIGQPADVVVAALVEFCRTDDLARATGAYALSQISSIEAKQTIIEILPQLVKTLHAGDSKVETATLVALEAIGAPAVFALLEEMSQEKTVVRQRAAQALEKIGEPAISLVIQTLSSQNQSLRLSAILALGLIGPAAKAGVPDLMILLEDPDPLVCGLAAYALGGIGSASYPAIPILTELLSHPDQAIRTNSAYALAGIGPLAIVAASNLIQNLQDSDTEVRLSTIHALGQIGADTAVENLIPLMSSQDEWIRLCVANALGQIGEAAQESVPMLIEALVDHHQGVRYNAINALILIGNSSIPRLINALKNGDRIMQLRVIDVLGQFGKSAIPELQKTLDDGSIEVCRGIITALGQIGPDAIPTLQLALKHPNSQVRWAATHSLKKIDTVEAAAVLSEYLDRRR